MVAGTYVFVVVGADGYELVQRHGVWRIGGGEGEGEEGREGRSVGQALRIESE